MSLCWRPARLVGSQNVIAHHFSTSTALYKNRAIIYTSNGPPPTVLSARTYPSLPPPAPYTLNIKYLLSPINPADVNVIEGVYPTKPTLTSLSDSGARDLFVAGNEGLAEVTDVGAGVSGIKKGAWVVMGEQQLGTWRSRANVQADDVVRVPKGTSEVGAATITVNPATAYNMLSLFVDLKEGDWVIQNGANSAVGQAVIQIAAARGINTINLVRNRREDIGTLKQQLYGLGATQIATYDDIANKFFRATVKEWTGDKHIRLALNCVSGPVTTDMARYLGQDAVLVSYGAMSKQPLVLPTSLFIFKNLSSAGFSQTRWYVEKTREEREELMGVLVGLMRAGKLKEPEHEIMVLETGESDEDASQKVRDVLSKLSEGRYGKKVLLRIEGE